MRVQESLELAQKILADQNWDIAAANRVLDRGRIRYVNLDEHLPVLLYYLTAGADEQGRVGFRRDVCGCDASLLAAPEAPPDADRIVFREAPEMEPNDELQPIAGS